MKQTSCSRRQFAQLSSAGLFPTLGLSQEARKPNVLFIFTDDQRGDTIRALGNSVIETPNLDLLVQSGTSFTNAYCMGGWSAAVCLPSRYMALRGNGWFKARHQPANAPNFPTTMKEAGYVTYHLGKYGNTDQRTHKSFDFNYYLEPGDLEELGKAEPGRQLADRAKNFLHFWKTRLSRSGSKPFFMYLSGPAPHDPRLAPDSYMNRYEISEIPLPPNYLPYHPFDNGELLIRDERLANWPRTEYEVRRHLRDYYGMITHLDEQLGRIVNYLKEIGEYDNTIIVFASDQGLAIGSHGLMGKQNLYEHSMNPALVFSGPGIPSGKKVDGFAYLFDIFPTVCDLAGAPIPTGLEGRSQAAVIRRETESVRDTVFLAYKDLQRAVRRGRWKLIQYPKINRTQLFDLESDPHETTDLAGEARHSGLIAELKELMLQEQRSFGDRAPLTSPDPPSGDIDLEFFERSFR